MNNNEYNPVQTDTPEYIKANLAVQSAKQILLGNRVQNFQAADVVALAKILIDLQGGDKQ